MTNPHFGWIETGDGSPSLQIISPQPGLKAESMHHSGGAYSETQYIYGEAIRRALGLGGRSFLSLGLGVGYNELLMASECLDLSGVRIFSFETDTQLVSDFLRFLRGENFEGVQFYEKALSYFKKEGLKQWLLRAYKAGDWKIGGALPLSADQLRAEVPSRIDCFLYDAFSAATSPSLWSEEFLTLFLQTLSGTGAVFSTYACNGTLKRALRAADFEVTIRPGFLGKRDCTFARRKR